MCRRPAWTRAIFRLLPFALLLVLVSTVAFARPGGGESYSGGGSGGGGGSSDAGDYLFVIDILIFVLQLVFEYPAIGIPLLVLLGAAFLFVKVKEGWSTASNPPAGNVGTATTSHEHVSARKELERAFVLHDTNFSLPVFEDFLYFLYAEVERARGSGTIDQWTPYVSPEVRKTLRDRDAQIAGKSLRAVDGIVIGAMSYKPGSVFNKNGRVSVTVLIDANYTEHVEGGSSTRCFARSSLTLQRSTSAKSREPGKAQILGCPNCGAPLQAVRGDVCSYCNARIVPGKQDWAITDFTVEKRTTVAPFLGSSVEEQGTDLASVVNPGIDLALTRLTEKDPAFTRERLQARVGVIFETLQQGWTARDPLRIRPYMSDNLFQSQVYFIDLYKEAKAINRTDGARITKIVFANVTTDAYYDAITLRVFAEGADYTESEDGKLLSGHRKKKRKYSEYWTLLRGSNGTTIARDDRACPNCGAQLKIEMTGNCAHCRAKVTAGDFDWVLSRIEQDDSYVG